MSIRILRAIRFFDWSCPCDIADALNIPSRDQNLLERNNFDVTMSRLCVKGHIERRRYVAQSWSYRITQSGRDLLQRELARSVPA